MMQLSRGFSNLNSNSIRTHVKRTSVSCSRWPIRDRDSPRSCRWAAASMGSTSGTLAGESATAAGALLGDTTPVPIAEAAKLQVEIQEGRSKRSPHGGWRCTVSIGGVCDGPKPLLLVSVTLLCLTVVASALFCLCCRYCAFCRHTCEGRTKVPA